MAARIGFLIIAVLLEVYAKVRLLCRGSWGLKDNVNSELGVLSIEHR